MIANIIRSRQKTAIGGGGGGIVIDNGDPFYSAVSMLLPMDGTNGSTTFTDSSLNAITVTAVGNAQVSTTQGKYGGASAYFDGSGDYLDIPYGNSLNITTDYTIEFWMRADSVAGYAPIFSITSATTSFFGGIYVVRNSSAITFETRPADGSGSSVIAITGGSISTNTWYHVAASVSGNSARLFINGVQIGSTTTFPTRTFTPTGARIGRFANNFISGLVDFNGYIDDFRISQFARYTSTFTPPTAALPTTASYAPADPYYGYTSLLLHMDGTNASTNFVDSGPSARTITAVGNAQISTTQSKYGGASAYFDGTGDYLSFTGGMPSGSGTAFTIECWIRLDDLNSYRAISRTGGGLDIGVQPSGMVVCDQTGVGIIADSATGIIAAGNWYHIAVTRDTSNAYKVYVNGTQVASGTNSFSVAAATTIGFSAFSGAHYFKGYIDDFRATNVLRYTSAFTPPAQAHPNIYNPYTTLPVSGAALWLAGDDSSTLYTDAGTSAVTKSGDLVYQWTDKSGNSRNAIQATSGNRPTWVAPANARNNLGAVGFNASQWIDLADNTSLAFGTSDFTVECWIKPTSFSGNSFLLAGGTNSFCIYFASTGALNIGHYGVAGLGASSVISTSTWTHVAISRSGTSLRVFLNGTLTNTFTNSSNFQGNQVTRVGWDPAPANGNIKYNGQIQNLIVYNGQALYTANFTPWMS